MMVRLGVIGTWCTGRQGEITVRYEIYPYVRRLFWWWSHEAGSPQITATKYGALVVSFMTDEDTSLHQWLVLFSNRSQLLFFWLRNSNWWVMRPLWQDQRCRFQDRNGGLSGNRVLGEEDDSSWRTIGMARLAPVGRRKCSRMCSNYLPLHIILLRVIGFRWFCWHYIMDSIDYRGSKGPVHSLSTSIYQLRNGR